MILDDLSAGRREIHRGPHLLRVTSQTKLLTRSSANAGDAVVHCAAKIIVPESVAEPLLYYHNNVGKTVTLLEAWAQRRQQAAVQQFGVRVRRPQGRFRGH